MENDVTTGKELDIFRKYLVPSMLSMLAVSAYSFVDTFVVGQAMGAPAVAAMGLGTPVLCLLYAIGFLLGAGGGVNYSVYMMQGKREKARTVFSAAFYCTIVLWIIIGIVGNLRIRQLALFLGATSGNIDLTVAYLRWVVSLSGFMIMDLVMNNFMRNEGHPNVSMAATVTGTSLNIVLDFLFVLGFHWGMGGAASATCISSIVSVCINSGYALFGKTNLKPMLNCKCFVQLPRILQIGFGSFALEGAVSVISVVFLNFAGDWYGDNGVSAFSILMTLNLVVYSLINGVAQAIQPLVSANFGAGKRNRMRKFVRFGLIASLVMGIFFFIVAEVIPVPLVKLFVTDNEEVAVLAACGLRQFAFAFIFLSVSILLGIYFQSETKPVQSLVILLGRSAVLPILFLYILSLVKPGGCLWYAIPAGEGAAMVLSLVLYQMENKK